MQGLMECFNLYFWETSQGCDVMCACTMFLKLGVAHPVECLGIVIFSSCGCSLIGTRVLPCLCCSEVYISWGNCTFSLGRKLGYHFRDCVTVRTQLCLSRGLCNGLGLFNFPNFGVCL